MLKTISVEADQSTWPLSGPPIFPTKFPSSATDISIDVEETLHLIGQLTTPPIPAGFSLSEYWAWVRYLSAIGPSSDLRVTLPFANLDSHQKVILSDDFGMGFPMRYLIDQLDFIGWCDGRLFVERFGAMLTTPPPKPKKRGPSKSPDFICLDATGRLHVVECKGTQSGRAKRNAQLDHNGSSGPSGGVVQKRTVSLPPHIQGQRLACGLAIAIEGGPQVSHLRIVDPEFNLIVRDQDSYLVEDPIIRSIIAIAARSCGLTITADAVVAPSGRTPASRPLTGRFGVRFESERVAFIDQRRTQAQAEIKDRITGALSPARISRSASFVLPKPIESGKRNRRRVRIRQSINPDFLRRFAEKGLDDGPIPQIAPWAREYFSGVKFESGDGYSSMTIGEVFASEMWLR